MCSNNNKILFTMSPYPIFLDLSPYLIFLDFVVSMFVSCLAPVFVSTLHR